MTLSRTTFYILASTSFAILSWTLLTYNRANPRTNVTMSVFAAASTIDAMDEIVDEFLEYENSPLSGNREFKYSIKVNYAASSTLRMLQQNGGKADLFLSALVEPDSTKLLTNRLVAIQRTETASPMAIQDFNGRIAMGDPKHVPAGLYAKKHLEKSGQWNRVRPIAASDVRQVLAMVCSGAAETGIVYATDAHAAADQVKIVHEFDNHPEFQPTYSVRNCIVIDGKTTPQEYAITERLLEFLRGETGREIFARHGFTPIEDE